MFVCFLHEGRAIDSQYILDSQALPTYYTKGRRDFQHTIPTYTKERGTTPTSSKEAIVDTERTVGDIYGHYTHTRQSRTSIMHRRNKQF